MAHLVTILDVERLTHDVLKITAEKPVGLNYVPGQAVDISLSKKGWENELRAFTFTSLPEDDHIEFTIKTYENHKGVTQQMISAVKEDKIMIHDVFGDISYKGEGIFIAGGAGVTPFISIFKLLEKNNAIGSNKLIFANKTKADIILENKFNEMLGHNFINILSEEKIAGYEYGFITAELIKKHLGNKSNFFYLCGPEPMMQAVVAILTSLNIPDYFIVKEVF